MNMPAGSRRQGRFQYMTTAAPRRSATTFGKWTVQNRSCVADYTFAIQSATGRGSIASRLFIQRLAHDHCKLLQRERLRQEAELRVRRQVAGEGILRIARHEDELHIRIFLAQLAQE